MLHTLAIISSTKCNVWQCSLNDERNFIYKTHKGDFYVISVRMEFSIKHGNAFRLQCAALLRIFNSIGLSLIHSPRSSSFEQQRKMYIAPQLQCFRFFSAIGYRIN